MCQEWIDRGRLVCLLSSSLLHAIISLPSLTSPMTVRLLAEFPVLIGLSSPLSHPLLSLRLLAVECHVCSPSRKFCQWSEGCKKHVPAGSCRIFFPFSPQWAHLRWDFEELNELWTTLAHFTILHCSTSFCCLSFLILPSLDRILGTGVITDRALHVPEIIWSLVTR